MRSVADRDVLWFKDWERSEFLHAFAITDEMESIKDTVHIAGCELQSQEVSTMAAGFDPSRSG
ncbi:MAG TPA: hypothetical protein VLL25_02590 [Acidimicrobiales bacterium]|nr:hypothetical protein [Acidimicrobiales bacterium]